MGILIQDITSKSAKIASTDLIEIAQVSGASYVSRKVTGAEINELSLDTSPQLGGDLDVSGFKITTDSDQDVIISPNGIGLTEIQSNLNLRDDSGSTAKQINFFEGFSNGSNYVGIKAANSLSANTTYTLPTADGTNGQTLATNGSGVLSWQDARYITKNTQTNDYTLVITDDSKLIEMNKATANTLTIPLNSSVAFPIGTQILITQYGAGQTTVSATVGVTLRSSGGKTKTSAQYAIATLIKRDTDEWYLAGDITT